FAAQVALKGNVATKFKEQGQEYDIRVRLRPEDRKDMNKLRQILVHSQMLDMDVPLSEVAYIVQGTGPSQIERLDQQRSIMVTANIFKRGFTKVMEDIQAALNRYKIPEGFSVNMGGEREEMQKSFKSLKFALILSLFLNYMVMAAEFESLWQPLIIMFTIPLSLIGVALGLALTHTSLNAVVMLGVIMLGGIAVNNGIVLVDTINLFRKEGMKLEDALVQAGTQRLRPIMMTSLTTILGLLPLAMGLGEGAELRAPMAITVMGGLTSATFLTLVVIPALYLTAVRFFELFGKKPVLAEEEIKLPVISIELKPPEVKEEKSITLVRELEKPKEEITPVLNERQKKFLEALKSGEHLTRKDYFRLYNVSVPTAARDLKVLLDRGLIRVKGPAGPGRWYEIV
ncbi:MAG: efflux RND transporter permease subunit, partial [Candidatus Omnitrophica bacterium]|nr:efflux RND transporter permease subunit [Candidatus Omnitrophota bacterium]